MPSSPDPRGSIRTGHEFVTPSGFGPGGRRDDAAEARLEGFRAGREEGFRVGRDEGRATADAAVAGAIAALGSAAQSLAERDALTRSEVEQLSIALALELTESLVGHGPESLESGQDMLNRALGLRRGSEPVRVRMHPADAAALDAQAQSGLELVADPTIGRGQATAELGEAIADLSIDAALARIRAALT